LVPLGKKQISFASGGLVFLPPLMFVCLFVSLPLRFCDEVLYRKMPCFAFSFPPLASEFSGLGHFLCFPFIFFASGHRLSRFGLKLFFPLPFP